MDRNACLFLFAILGVVLALAGPVAGGMTAKFAGGPESWSRDAAALRQLLSTSRLEDGVAPELPVDLSPHRPVLAATVGNSALEPDRPACTKSCPAPGEPYTGRDCEKVYQCRR